MVLLGIMARLMNFSLNHHRVQTMGAFTAEFCIGSDCRNYPAPGYRKEIFVMCNCMWHEMENRMCIHLMELPQEFKYIMFYTDIHLKHIAIHASCTRNMVYSL